MAYDKTNEARRLRCPEDVLAWIPWYADGGLTAREKGAVEAHAALCGDCRTEIDIVSGAPWALDDVALPDADRLFGEIRARIETEERGEQATVIPISRARTLSDADMARIERWVLDPGSERETTAIDGADEIDPSEGIGELEALEAVGASARAVETGPDSSEDAARLLAPSLRPRRRAFGARSPLWAAAAAVVLFAAGALSGSHFERPQIGFGGEQRPADDAADYQLASASPASDAAAASAAAPAIDVVFADSASARDIWNTLRGLGVEIVSGPSNLGVYRLRLLPAAVEGREPTAADAAAVAARLVAADAPLAIFAEPVP